MKRISAWLVGALLGAPAVAQESEATPFRSWTLRDVRVTTRDVFAEDEAIESPFYRFFNMLHVTTVPEVVRRELWFEPGQTFTEKQVEELERNLRWLNLFGGVETRVVPTGVEGEADLEVETRDRFSLLAFARVSSVGGVTTFDGSLGELNFLGRGKRLVLRGNSNDEDEYTYSLSYDDPQFLGSWWDLAARVGVTEEGQWVSVDLRRPFQHLEDPLSYGVAIATQEDEVDYFQGGSTISEVPVSRDSGSAFVAHGFGPRDLRGRIGVDLSAADLDYGAPTGAAVQVPGDTTRFGAGVIASIDYIAEFLQLTGIDSFDFVHDEKLGVFGQVRVGMLSRDEDGAGHEVQPVASANLRAAFAPADETWVTVEGQASGRWYAGHTRGWRTTAALHAFQASLPRQVLAASVAFDAGFETQDLVPQFTLGEDNGLRGYPAREFGGTRRVRLNVENRIDPGIEVASVHVGFVAFFDVGWVHGRDQNLSQGEALKSVGAGMRFGSSEILGRNVLRLDFGFPLDDVNGEDYSLSVSFSGGQVFGFFGNTSELRTEF